MKIWHMQIQIYPQTSIEAKFSAFYFKNKVSAHGLVLLGQLSWRVVPPCKENPICSLYKGEEKTLPVLLYAFNIVFIASWLSIFVVQYEQLKKIYSGTCLMGDG